MTQSTIARPAWISRPTRRRSPGFPPLLRRTYTPRVIEWNNGFAGLVPARRPDRPALAHLPRPGARRLDRRRRHQAQAGLRHRPACDRRHRPGRHVRQRLPVRRRRAAALPRLRRHEPRRSGPDRQIVKGISDGCVEAECALLGGETAILPDFYQPGRIRPGRILPGGRRAEAHSRRPGDPGGRQGRGRWPARACIPMATAWRGRSSSSRRA